MNQVRLFSTVTGLAVLIGCSGLSLKPATAAGEERTAKEEPPVKEEFSTDLKGLKGVGPADEGRRVLHLHIEEENRDGFLQPFFSMDPFGGLEPVWRSEGASAALVITNPLHEKLGDSGRRRIEASGILKDGRIADDVRLLISHRVSFPEGARRPAGEWLQLVCRYIYRVDTLPASLDIEALGGGPEVGPVAKCFPEKAKFRFLERLEVLGVQADGTVRLRYGGDEFVLPPGKRWPAAVKGATHPTDELVARMTGAGRNRPEKEVQIGRRLVERILGDQVGVRFTTKVDIVNRGVVTVTVGGEKGEKR